MFQEYMLLNTSQVELHTLSFINGLSIYEIKRILKTSSERPILAFTGYANSDKLNLAQDRLTYFFTAA